MAAISGTFNYSFTNHNGETELIEVVKFNVKGRHVYDIQYIVNQAHVM